MNILQKQNLQTIKWFLELANQEYKGHCKILRSNYKQMRIIE